MGRGPRRGFRKYLSFEALSHHCRAVELSIEATSKVDMRQVLTIAVPIAKSVLSGPKGNRNESAAFNWLRGHYRSTGNEYIINSENNF